MENSTTVNGVESLRYLQVLLYLTVPWLLFLDHLLDLSVRVRYRGRRRRSTGGASTSSESTSYSSDTVIRTVIELSCRLIQIGCGVV